MKINDLIKDIDILEYVNFTTRTYEEDIKNLCDNSNEKIKLKDSAFICIEGISFDSHNITNELEKCGVKFFICTKKIDTNIPYIIVKDTREVIGKLADNFYNNPTKSFRLIGVIGTNGKTSTTYFIQKLLKINKIACGVIGTSGVFIKNKRLEETLTTPDPLLLYKLFSLMRDAGCKVVVMEISAHAIALKKVKNLVCDIVIFTNFSQDHLDFFKTMENYKQVKFSFFNSVNCKKALININDEVGQELYNNIKKILPTKTYAVNCNASLYAKNVDCKIDKTTFELTVKKQKMSITTKVTCEFNIFNILSSVLCLLELGINFDIKKCLNQLTNVDGRFNIIKGLKNRVIIIDYAHTPKSTESVLKSAKELSGKKLKVVIGCPGNRDEEKRQMTGEICYIFCEKVYITADNPKYENPLIICNEVLKGAKEKGIIIEDRETAIKKAMKELKENEILLIIGKATEKYQDYNNLKIPYNDFNVVYECIKKSKKQ